jgi:hypothetical protein
MINFKILTFGNFCNDPPFFSVSIDNIPVWEGTITGKQEISLDIDSTPVEISLSGIGKKDGKNGLYDTYIDEDNNIINDKYLVIEDILFNDISMGKSWLQSQAMFTEQGNRNSFVLSTFWNNGKVTFTVNEPLLDWIIQEKFINILSSSNREYVQRSGETKFDYRLVIEKIKIIKELLNDKNTDI